MYYPIQKFIEYVQKNPPPKTYYTSKYHKGYIASLSLEDYGKWVESCVERKKAYNKKWIEENKEYLLLKRREYRQENRELCNERKRIWWHNLSKEKREEYLAKKREYRNKHREETNRKKLENYYRNREYYLDYGRWYYRTHKLARETYNIEWQKEHLSPEKRHEIYKRWCKKKTIEERRAIFRENAKRYRERHREKYRKYVREFMRKKYAQMTDEQKRKRAEYYKAWQQKNRDKICQYTRKYNAKKRAEAIKNTESNRQNQAVVEVQAV